MLSAARLPQALRDRLDVAELKHNESHPESGPPIHAYRSLHVGTTSQGNEQSLSVRMP